MQITVFFQILIEIFTIFNVRLDFLRYLRFYKEAQRISFKKNSLHVSDITVYFCILRYATFDEFTWNKLFLEQVQPKLTNILYTIVY